MSAFVRQLGHLAGGVSQGLLAGTEMKNRKDLTADTLKTNEARRGAYKNLGALVKQYGGSSLAETFAALESDPGSDPGTVVPRAMVAAGEDGTALAPPTAAPAAVSPLANSMLAPAQPTPMMTMPPRRRLPFAPDEA